MRHPESGGHLRNVIMATVTLRRKLVFKIQKRLSNLSTSQLLTVASSIDDGGATCNLDDLSEPELYDLIVDYIRSEGLRVLEDEGMAQLLLLDDMLSDLLATDTGVVKVSQATPPEMGDYSHPTTPTTDIPTHSLHRHRDIQAPPPLPLDRGAPADPSTGKRDIQTSLSPMGRDSDMPARSQHPAPTMPLTAGVGGAPLGG